MPDKAKRYRIGDLVREFDVTPRTLRYYEELGLLSPERRGNQRYYTPRDRTRLRLILRGRRLGFSLEEIEKMLALYDLDPSGKTQLKEVLRMGEAKIKAIESQIKELKALKKEIEARARELRRLLEED